MAVQALPTPSGRSLSSITDEVRAGFAPWVYHAFQHAPADLLCFRIVQKVNNGFGKRERCVLLTASNLLLCKINGGTVLSIPVSCIKKGVMAKSGHLLIETVSQLPDLLLDLGNDKRNEDPILRFPQKLEQIKRLRGEWAGGEIEYDVEGGEGALKRRGKLKKPPGFQRPESARQMVEMEKWLLRTNKAEAEQQKQQQQQQPQQQQQQQPQQQQHLPQHQQQQQPQRPGQQQPTNNGQVSSTSFSQPQKSVEMPAPVPNKITVPSNNPHTSQQPQTITSPNQNSMASNNHNYNNNNFNTYPGTNNPIHSHPSGGHVAQTGTPKQEYNQNYSSYGGQGAPAGDTTVTHTSMVGPMTIEIVDQPLRPKIPEMPWFEPCGYGSSTTKATLLADTSLEGDSVTFPSDKNFWDNLMVHKELDDNANCQPVFELKAEHLDDPLVVNQTFFRQFVAGWELANPHLITITTSLGSELFHASAEFWAFYVDHRRNMTGILDAIVQCDDGPHFDTNVEEWNRICILWEEYKGVTLADKQRTLDEMHAVASKRREEAESRKKLLEQLKSAEEQRKKFREGRMTATPQAGAAPINAAVVDDDLRLQDVPQHRKKIELIAPKASCESSTQTDSSGPLCSDCSGVRSSHRPTEKVVSPTKASAPNVLPPFAVPNKPTGVATIQTPLPASFVPPPTLVSPRGAPPGRLFVAPMGVPPGGVTGVSYPQQGMPHQNSSATINNQSGAKPRANGVFWTAFMQEWESARSVSPVHVRPATPILSRPPPGHVSTIPFSAGPTATELGSQYRVSPPRSAYTMSLL